MMAEFKADGTSDEDKLAWVGEYKKAMEPQDQLPLLFQTMTVRQNAHVHIVCREPNFLHCFRRRTS